MDVTRLNFRKVLPEIEDTINRCVFMAIDGEFTGLTTGLERAVSSFDTPEEYYHKLRSGSLDFLLIQFGLVTFMYNEETKQYTHRAYNFYLFPRPLNRQAPDCRFLCQTSSMDFLASHGFNFNKLFNEGIPYLNQRDEIMMRARQDEARERRKSLTGDRNNSSFVDCPPEHTETVKKHLNSIAEYLTSKEGEEELTLPPINAFIRKLIYQEVWKRYTADEIRIETKNGVMVIRRPISEEARAAEEQVKLEEEEEAMNNAVGFSQVIRLISQSRKLVVGHNMLLDLCHVIHRFCEPLPESYLEFKELLHSVFPYVLDTKFLCCSPFLVDLVPSTVLGHILASVSEPPFTLLKVEPEGEEAYSTLDLKEHEAGFDAYMTGTAAIALSNYLAKRKKKDNVIEGLPSTSTPHLQKYINRLYLMKVIEAHIDLERDDPEPNREAVFHVTFPEEWRMTEIVNMFSPFGSVFVSWVSSTSAYVGLNDKTQAVNVMRRLVPDSPTGVSVCSYYAYHNTAHASPHNGRRKHSLTKESSLKRPSVEPIAEVPEESEATGEERPRKKRKVETKELPKDSQNKLFEENQDW